MQRYEQTIRRVSFVTFPGQQHVWKERIIGEKAKRKEERKNGRRRWNVKDNKQWEG